MRAKLPDEGNCRPCTRRTPYAGDAGLPTPFGDGQARLSLCPTPVQRGRPAQNPEVTVGAAAQVTVTVLVKPFACNDSPTTNPT